jgi:hypothetical protein
MRPRMRLSDPVDLRRCLIGLASSFTEEWEAVGGNGSGGGRSAVLVAAKITSQPDAWSACSRGRAGRCRDPLRRSFHARVNLRLPKRRRSRVDGGASCALSRPPARVQPHDHD